MIKIKSQEDIELMRASSNLVAKTHAHIASVIKPGITLITIDKIAEEFIRDNGGIPAFKGYRDVSKLLLLINVSLYVFIGHDVSTTKFTPPKSSPFISNADAFKGQ